MELKVIQMSTKLQSLYNDGFISLPQLKRISLFLDAQTDWMVSEEDPSHPNNKKEIEEKLVSFIDLYLWLIDPIILKNPISVHQLARIWIEKNITEMDHDEAANLLSEWINVYL